MRGLTPLEAGILRTVVAVEGGTGLPRHCNGDEQRAADALIMQGRLVRDFCKCCRRHFIVNSTPLGREALRIHDAAKLALEGVAP